ncbi:hypothetical protein THAOC_26936, partial [Thalassiosira oceanica]
WPAGPEFDRQQPANRNHARLFACHDLSATVPSKFAVRFAKRVFRPSTDPFDDPTKRAFGRATLSTYSHGRRPVPLAAIEFVDSPLRDLLDFEGKLRRPAPLLCRDNSLYSSQNHSRSTRTMSALNSSSSLLRRACQSARSGLLSGQTRGMAGGKEIRFGVEGRAAMLKGVDMLADAVQVRMILEIFYRDGELGVDSQATAGAGQGGR